MGSLLEGRNKTITIKTTKKPMAAGSPMNSKVIPA